MVGSGKNWKCPGLVDSFQIFSKLEINVINNFNFFRESQARINYLQENYLKPLKIAEEKANRILMPLKDVKTLESIYGIIETNSVYLTSNNEVSGMKGG